MLERSVCHWIESVIPSFISANALLIIGYLPLQVMIPYVFWEHCDDIDPDFPVSSETMIYGAVAILW